VSLSAHARREVERRAGEVVGNAVRQAGVLGRRVLSALATRTAEGWQLFVRGTPRAGAADAFLIGAAGVFAIVVAEQAVDEAAMSEGATSAEDYQAGFTWGNPDERPGTAAAAADAAVAETVAAYPKGRLSKMTSRKAT